MTGPYRALPRDLLAVCLLTVAALIVAIAHPAGWLQAMALLPLVLILPGYAICAALFPSDLLPRDERIVYALTFSIGAAALGGLATQVLLALSRGVWIGTLATVTLAAALAAAQRRHSAPQPGHPTPRRSLGLLSATAILASMAIAGGAIALAADGARDQSRRQVFASLWAVPDGASLSDGLTVGVWNHARGSVMRLEVSRRGRTIRSWRLGLRGDQRWQASIDGSLLPQHEPVLISLYRRGALFRSVHLDVQAEP